MHSVIIKQKAIELRQQGRSYREISTKLGLSKSTLSGWLQNIALSQKDVLIIKDKALLARVEKTRNIKKLKKQKRLDSVLVQVAEDIENSHNQLFVAGFYLYWGEGTKSAPYTVSLTNSDPALIRCFVDWLQLLGVSLRDIRIKLHIYTDQDEQKLKKFWSQVTGVSVNNFNKSYSKLSKQSDKNYTGMFGCGTCVVAYHNRDMHEYVLQGITYLRNKNRGGRFY